MLHRISSVSHRCLRFGSSMCSHGFRCIFWPQTAKSTWIACFFTNIFWRKRSECTKPHINIVQHVLYPLVNKQFAIENGHRNSGCSHEKMVMFHRFLYVYQRVNHQDGRFSKIAPNGRPRSKRSSGTTPPRKGLPDLPQWAQPSMSTFKPS